MTYRDIEDLQMLLDKDIRSVIAKGDITPQDYQCLDVAVDITKDLYEIASMIPMMEEGTSGNSYDSYANGGNNRGGNNSGNSYGMYGDYYSRTRSGARGNNRVGGNSGHMSMEEKLNTMMQNASNEQERQVISKLMKEMENM